MFVCPIKNKKVASSLITIYSGDTIAEDTALYIAFHHMMRPEVISNSAT
jgi:hypothetical protein